PRPIPRPAPVTIATLPSSIPIVNLPCRLRAHRRATLEEVEQDVEVAGRVPELGQHGCHLAAVLRVVVRHVDQNLPPRCGPDATPRRGRADLLDRKSTRLNSSHVKISYAVFCLKKKTKKAGSCSSPL